MVNCINPNKIYNILYERKEMLPVYFAMKKNAKNAWQLKIANLHNTKWL